MGSPVQKHEYMQQTRTPSRRQEAQRAGRLMHGEGGEHIIMMTDRELMKHEKRLYSLEEQGFRIRYERRA